MESVGPVLEQVIEGDRPTEQLARIEPEPPDRVEAQLVVTIEVFKEPLVDRVEVGDEEVVHS